MSWATTQPVNANNNKQRENWIVINTVVKYSWTEFVRLTVATVTDTR